jgi:Na+/H+ antiporter NhaD/arsenite permease-like protein
MTDNAALTYLGAQVPTLAESARYFLVAGAVVGGGLTVIANAPNPVGYAILRGSFGATGISAVRLLLAALPPTLVAALIFWLF